MANSKFLMEFHIMFLLLLNRWIYFRKFVNILTLLYIIWFIQSNAKNSIFSFETFFHVTDLKKFSASILAGKALIPGEKIL